MVSKGRWITDLKVDATIKVCDGTENIKQVGKGDDFVWVERGKCRIYSYYASPNTTLDDFVQYLNALGRSISGYGDQLIIAGDFNAKAYPWGSEKEDPRGGALAEFVARLDLTVPNGGDPNVTLITRTSVPCWKVCSDWEVMSDHVPILLEVSRQK
jgi:hypothetical protein